ncbi:MULTISPECIES: hypothetical protein [Aliagarivorans]|uniref:hypothetical protein n=1 Tax=Aliagarivorans TaxID=882379 RepID=UPI0004019564|nr:MULTISPECIES: hypothetical protein [Aliagarivorans]
MQVGAVNSLNTLVVQKPDTAQEKVQQQDLNNPTAARPDDRVGLNQPSGDVEASQLYRPSGQGVQGTQLDTEQRFNNQAQADDRGLYKRIDTFV